MHTITLQINSDDALKTLQDLEGRHLISIIESSNVDSPSLPGAALSLNEFKNWVQHAEQTSTVSLTEAKEKWVSRKKQLQNLTGKSLG